MQFTKGQMHHWLELWICFWVRTAQGGGEGAEAEEVYGSLPLGGREGGREGGR